MFSSILSDLFSSVGGDLFGSAGAFIGKGLGKTLGSNLEKSLTRNNQTQYLTQGVINELYLQKEAYGNFIPIIFGKMRVGGNIICALPLTEKIERHHYRASKNGPKIIKDEYKYFTSVAIGICEGPIDSVDRIWVGKREIDLSEIGYRLYKGDESQMPDPALEKYFGADQTPAYRGLAYIVIENFPISEFGEMPHFTFEVTRKIYKSNEQPLEELIQGLSISGIGGEFAYDTKIQTKNRIYTSDRERINIGNNQPINMNNKEKVPDAMLALKQMQSFCPNVKWINLDIFWFASSLKLDEAILMPGVEFKSNEFVTAPDEWRVGGYNRNNACQINYERDRPIYGGTCSDQSLINYIDELKRRGYNIMITPKILVNLVYRPYRGRISGKPESVPAFFGNQYNKFILHYANLLKGKIDAFAIGSELVSLTRVGGGVNEFINLASDVKRVLGTKTKLTYAAGWYEYKDQTLKELWDSSAIDVISVNAYFPLTSEVDSNISVQELITSLEKLEVNDWIKAQRKEVWFSELGFSSIDLATNQPHFNADEASIEHKLPPLSHGLEDLNSQRIALEASLKYWSERIKNIFVYYWDSRPYPAWPENKEIWRDGANWARSKALNGKLGFSNLAGVISYLCNKIGLDNIEVNECKAIIEGYAIPRQSSLKTMLAPLLEAYSIEILESNNKIKFKLDASKTLVEISQDEVIGEIESVLISESYLPSSVSLKYIERAEDYSIGMVRESIGNARGHVNLELPIVMNAAKAKIIATKYLQDQWEQRKFFKIKLPPKFVYLEVGLRIKIAQEIIKITSLSIEEGMMVVVEGVALG